jgi:hypothetical protein
MLRVAQVDGGRFDARVCGEVVEMGAGLSNFGGERSAYPAHAS